MSARATVLGLIVVALVVLGFNSVFIVNEKQRAVLLEFGKVVRNDVPPGLHFKMPFINKVRKFDGRVVTLDAEPERFLTLEKKALIVDSFVKYRIDDVQTFYTSTAGDELRVANLLRQRINTGLRNEVGNRSLHEVVSGERDELMQALTRQADIVARQQLGVEVVDVRVKRIDLPDEVSQSVYERMNTEREIEASEHRAQGRELAAGIEADADRQTQVILAEAYSEAQNTRGEGDAKATKTYANAYNRDREFYKFYRSMTAYRNTFSNKSDILILEPDSDFFRYLNNSQGSQE